MSRQKAHPKPKRIGLKGEEKFGPEDVAAVNSIAAAIGEEITGKRDKHVLPALSVVAVRVLKQLGLTIGNFSDLMTLNWNHVHAKSELPGEGVAQKQPEPPAVQ